MNNTTYNFEELHNRFTRMTTTDIIREYVSVTKKRTSLVNNINCDIAELEQIDTARDFLGHFLALSYCEEHGITP